MVVMLIVVYACQVELMEEPEEEKAVHPLLALFISDKTLGVLDTGRQPAIS